MSITQSQNRNEVKNVKFHHKVKRFYHKNLFRKIYTVAIIGLIGANVFSMVKYSSFADELEGLDQAPVINQVVEDEEIIPDWLELGMDDSDLNEISTDISPIDDKDDISTVSGEVVEDLSDSLDEVHLAAPETDKEEIKIQATEDNPSNLPANWEFGTITLLNQQNPEYAITIMDRNLGATTNDITDKGSYGYYYQYGRNYGFPGAASCNNLDDEGNGACYMRNSDAELFDDYQDGDYDWEYEEQQQGPCPNGWHVMLHSDAGKIFEYYGNAAKINVDMNMASISVQSAIDYSQFSYDDYTKDRFLNYLKLPLAGYRDYQYINDIDYVGFYWETSKDYGIIVEENQMSRYDYIYDSKYYGRSVRCVSDNYEYEGDLYKVTFYDGGNNEPFMQYIVKNQRAIQPEYDNLEDKVLAGWNTSDGKRYDFSTPVTSDLQLYADWVDPIRYEDGYIKVFDGNREIWLKNGNQGVDPEEAEKFHQIYELLKGQEVCYENDSLGNNYDCNEEGYEEASSILGVQINDMGDVDDYISEHIYGNYYFWGNNEDMSTEHIIGEMQGKMGLDEETGWEEGSDMGNPCNSDEGEYLPTPDDWEELMSIWSNINGENHGSRYNAYSIPDGRERYSIGLNDYQKFANDMLIPDAGYYAEGFLMDQCSLDLNIQCGGSYQRYYYNNPSLLWTAKSDRGLYGIYNASDGYLGRTTDEAGDRQYVYNTTAAPVRCFIDPENLTRDYVVTFMDGDSVIKTKKVKDGWTIKNVKEPTKENYAFVGWYTDPELKNEFNISNPITEDVILYAKWAEKGVFYKDGYIKVTNGKDTIYVSDKNVGATVSQGLPIREDVNMKGYELFEKYGASEEFENAIMAYAREKGIDFYSIDDLFQYLDSPNPLDWEINTYYGEKMLGLFYAYINHEGLDEDEQQDLLKGMNKLYKKNFTTLDDCYRYFLSLEMDINSPEFMLFLIESVTNKGFDGDGDLDDALADAWDYVNDYYEYDPEYGEVDTDSFGNYYFWGNDNGVNYSDLVLGDKFRDEYIITNIEDLEANGFYGGNLGDDNTGWEEGQTNNPCNGENEYLPTGEDWKNLMKLWGDINRYEFFDDSQMDLDNDTNHEYMYYNYYFLIPLNSMPPDSKFRNDMLIPGAGSIYGNFCNNEPCEAADTMGLIVGTPWLWISQDGSGTVGSYDGHLYYSNNQLRIHNNYTPGNYDALPVRCFLNIEESEDEEDDTPTTPSTSEPTTPSTPVSSYSGGGRKKAESVTNMHNSADEKDSTQDDAKGSENTKTPTNSSSNASEGQTQNLDMNQYNTTYTPEQNRAYQFAKSHGITTTSSIREAKMNTPLTRIEMAKMLSYYAVNLLGQQPQHGAGVARFSDVPADLDEKYDNGVALAYQLGIMGINMPNNEFRPYDKVTRAEFATALSRMIYGMEDGKGRIKYYEPHMARLYNEGIINNTNPKMEELRGYVMTMLMRTVK